MTAAGLARYLLGALLALTWGALAACTGAPTSSSPTPSAATAPFQPSATALPTLVATPTPSATPAPSPSATTTPTATALPPATPTLGPPRGAGLPTPPDLDRYDLARRLGLVGGQPFPTMQPSEPVPYTVGRVDAFNLVDLENLQVYSIEAELRVVSPHAYWYVQQGLDIPLGRLEEAARAFEEEVRPTVAAYFGEWWAPGANGDARLSIVHARLRGAAGYYSSSDEYPRAVNPLSNERKTIYLDGQSREVGSFDYYGVLAHELQHALHWSHDPGEESWVNEGLSEMAAFLAGYPSGLAFSFRGEPQTQLNTWATDPGRVLAHYGASYYFMRYLAAHYGGYDGLRGLVAEPADGIEGVNAYLAAQGYEESFLDVFAGWVVANYLPHGEGRYGYPSGSPQVAPSTTLLSYGSESGIIPQFSARYVEIRLDTGAARIRFDGAREANLLPTDPPGGSCWWSNLGDSIDSRLVREVDLSGLEQATLAFRAWYDIEKHWDHAYVVVSSDGGEHWDILTGSHTVAENPVGMALGPSVTGQSHGWVEVEADLSPYAGRKVLLGFEYVTDDATYGDGLCVDTISIPELGSAGAFEGSGGWQAQGFVRTSNRLVQEFVVQVVGLKGGEAVFVKGVPLDAENRGEVVVEGFGDTIDAATVVIAPVTQVTRQPASYTVTLESP